MPENCPRCSKDLTEFGESDLYQAHLWFCRFCHTRFISEDGDADASELEKVDAKVPEVPLLDDFN